MLAVAACAIALAACDSLTSPNANFGDLDELQTNPTRAGLATAAQGLIIGYRDYFVDPNDYVSMLGILGRESYNHDIADPRFESEMLGGDLQPSSPAFGGNFWSQPYANIRLADILLTGLDQVDDAEVAPGEKEAARGFAKTMQALDFLTIVNTRDESCGCPIEVPEDPTQPAPQVGKDLVFAHIALLLDEAEVHLEAGTAFPFRLSNGFDGFDTPDTFLAFNRGLRARVAVYMGDFQMALTALSGSFVDAAGDLDLGVYHTFSTGSGDRTNDLFQPGSDPNLRAHPSIAVDAELKTNGEPDDRLVRKTRPITSRAFNAALCTPQSQFPTCDIGFSIYNTSTTPTPILRNEELILLRAEANIGLGNLSAAETDINVIRARSGGLGPAPALTSQSQALDQLLYEKRYSLLFEGGHRWIDLRRYGKLDELPLDLPSHQVNAAYPIPLDETAARN
ncbi:MAG: RagB/SusD family nutrient uptake outer membrane protein [Gemmatimonadota bacterium]